MKKPVWLVSLILIAAGLSVAQEDEPSSLPNEGTFGVGVAFPFEKDPFNVPGEEKIPASLLLDVGYRHFLTERGAIGIRGFGYVKKLPDYIVTSSSNPTPTAVGFNLTAINIGLEGLWLFSNNPVQPFVFVMAMFTTGAITNSQTGTLRYQGGAGGGGLGVRVELSQTVILSLEGLGSWGRATWNQKPFTNSEGDTFDPGLMGLLLSASYRWP